MSAAWTRKEGKNPEGGLNAKGRASYHAETGGTLRPPLKAGDNPRRASFLARMGNMLGPMAEPDGDPTRLAGPATATFRAQNDPAADRARLGMPEDAPYASTMGRVLDGGESLQEKPTFALQPKRWVEENVFAPALTGVANLMGALDRPPTPGYPKDVPYTSPLRILSAANAAVPATAGAVVDTFTGARSKAPVVDPLRAPEEQATFGGEVARRGGGRIAQGIGTLADLLVDAPSVVGAAAPLMLGAGKLAKTAKAAAAARKAALLAEEATDVIRLYHGSNSVNDLTVANKGLFGGVFASGDKGVAESHILGAGRVHAFDVPRKDILTQQALEHDADPAVVNRVIRARLGRMNETELEAVRDIVLEDRSVYKSPLDSDRLQEIFRVPDMAETSWEAQRIRGEIAKELGYKAIEMNDEHGVTYLLLPGNVSMAEPDGDPTRLALSLKAWGASSKEDARAKAAAISRRNK